MEKEPYQPSEEEMGKAQEMADDTQNERGQETMTWDEKRASYLRGQDISKKYEERQRSQPSAEEIAKAQEMADDTQNERGEEMMTSEQKSESTSRERYNEEISGWTEMTRCQLGASSCKADIAREKRKLIHEGLGELQNIELKEYTIDNEGKENNIIFQGDVKGHRIEVKARAKNKEIGKFDLNYDVFDFKVSIDGLFLSDEDAELFLKNVKWLLKLQTAVYKYEKGIEEERKERERIENEQKASEILKSILAKEKDENN